LSMSPTRGDGVRKMLRSISSRETEEVATQSLCCSTPGAVRRLLAPFGAGISS
jgi:phosphoenolpyruvate-protein kinase (PTS system EI component)